LLFIKIFIAQQKQCFWVVKALIMRRKSIQIGWQKQCFYHPIKKLSYYDKILSFYFAHCTCVSKWAFLRSNSPLSSL